MNTAVRDNDGLLWVGTGEGLNCFDGYTVKKFYKEDYPALANNNIGGLICDEKNRIWVRTLGGKITLIDEQRHFIPIHITDNGKEVAINFMRLTKSRGLLFFAGSKLFTLDKSQAHTVIPVLWKEDTALQHNFGQLLNDGNDIIFLSGNNRLCIFDAVNLKVLHDILIPQIIGAVRLNENELLITTEKNQQLLRYNLAQQKIVKDYGGLKDQFGEPVRGYLRYIRRMNDGRYIITSGYGGVYIFDAVGEKIFRYQHDALDSRSISANNTFYVSTDSSGYVFVTTRSAGLNYFNTNFRLATYRSSFQESATGKIFHGFINYITQNKDGNFWMGTQSGLIEWDKEKNITRFHSYGTVNGTDLAGTEEIRTLCFDTKNRLWAGLNRYGIVVLDQNRNVIKYLNADSVAGENYLPGNFVNRMVVSPGNKLWVATATGLCIIDPENFRINRLQENEILKPLSSTYCYNVWFRSADEVWIATSKGAYRYFISTNQLTLFNQNNGLPGNTVICFTEDNNGTVYIGTSAGLSLFNKNKIIKTFRRNSGLRGDRCQGFLKDNNGSIWIANDNALLCYKPADSSFSVFDESYGLSQSGYRLLSVCRAATGEQFWGSDIGLSHFYPDQLQKIKFPLNVRISSVAAGGQEYPFSSAGTIPVPFSQNNLLFTFSAIDLFSSNNIQFEYRLNGTDIDWKKTAIPQQVTYNKLQPGNYTFQVRVSRDGLHWTDAANPATIHISTPWWKSWWFKILCITAVAGALTWLLRSRNKKIARQKEELETEQAVNYFASSIYEQKTADDILWDVTKNCISRLKFEDCVIYMKDEERKVLIQKAAWGPKTTDQNLAEGQAGKILNPMEIPIGNGIVGYVASTGIPEIVNDTSKDARYIVDDERRCSEIAVPIIYDGRVIGVIDSEHPKRNFFTARHLSILITIASLCANKIIRSRAEEARQKAQMELLEHQRKMAEVQLKSLRLQMSPHFLFNALNSIQQIILTGNDAAATKYLSRFSRLLRLVLQHSDREKISLKEEVETLNLYLELESLRFDDSFVYHINIEKTMDTDEIKIPTLLVQPFVENAIWHGLLHLYPGQGGQRKLDIRFFEDSIDNLICIVEDNGIGRKASQRINNKEVHTGKGLAVAEERVKTFNEQQTRKSFFTVEDVLDKKGEINGTRVTISLPLIK